MIVFDRVTKVYPNGYMALNNVSFKIDKGEFVFLTGESGAGKTTLIKLLHREQIPTKGKIYVMGNNLAEMHESDIPYYRREVSIVFQDFRLLDEKTVYENIEIVLKIRGFKRKKIQERVNKVLKMVGLYNKRNLYPCQLSGGEKQRVAIARAIVGEPCVIIADEPTGNLDFDNALNIMNIFEKINAYGITVIIATHDKNIVNLKQKRVIELQNGMIIRDKYN